MLQDLIHQVTCTATRHRRDAERVAQTQRVEVVRRVDQIVVVDLVADQDGAFLGTAQHLCHHHIEVGNACTYLHHKEDNIGLLDGQHHLLANLILEDIVAIDRVTTRVDNRKLTTIPIGLAVVAVTSSTRSRVDNRLTIAHKAVKKGTLAHIRASYYCY